MGKPSSDRQRMALFHSTIPSRYQAPLDQAVVERAAAAWAAAARAAAAREAAVKAAAAAMEVVG